MAVSKDDAVNAAGTPAEKPRSTGNVSPGFFGKIKRYLREVIAELKKTDWPSRDELTKSTIVIILTMVLVAIFLWASDWVSARIMILFQIVHETTGQ